MTAMGVYDQIKSAFQDIIAPELHAFRGDIQRLDQKIDHGLARSQGGDHDRARRSQREIDYGLAGLEQKIDNLAVRLDSLRTETVSMKGELLAEIRRLDTRTDGVDRELQTAIDVRERLAALEARRTPWSSPHPPGDRSALGDRFGGREGCRRPHPPTAVVAMRQRLPLRRLINSSLDPPISGTPHVIHTL